MTAERRGDDELGALVALVLETEANAIEVGDAWDAIASRLLQPGRPEAGLSPVSAAGRRRRVLGGVAAGLAAAAALVVAVVLGGSLTGPGPGPVPAAPAVTSVPRYDASIPTLVVYRPSSERPRTITPERMRTDSPAVGRAALMAFFDTSTVHPGSTQKVGAADVVSVRVSGRLIRVELDAFNGPLHPEPEAQLIAQALVRTLQDTLGVRDDVLIRLQGQPFQLYGTVGTAEPLARDESVRVVRPDGFDSPREGDVAPGTFLLLGSATAGPGQPAHVQVVDLDTGAIAHEHDVLGPAVRAAPVDFQVVLTLEPGRYRATLSGHGAVPGIREVTFTVVP